MKKCRICKTKFEPFNSLQVACSPACALKIGKKQAAKKAEKEAKAKRKWVREQKERIKSAKTLTQELQPIFNTWVRTRDEFEACISCGRKDHEIPEHFTGGKWDCGHYRSVGSCPELRFEPLNAHKQCKHCNRDLDGNVVNYRLGLIKRIGQEKVDWLEGKHEPKRYKADQLRDMKAEYRAATRELRRERKAA